MSDIQKTTNETKKTDIQKAAPTDALPSKQQFNLLVRRAQAYAASKLVPVQFQGEANVPNCIMALELADRLGISELAVMQHLYVVHGKPGWSSTFLIACINASRKFSPLRFEVRDGEKKSDGNRKYQDRICIAWALDRETNDRLESPPVSIEMAHLEGWATKSGSKWQTMPELMLRYRAATLFARLYAPEITLGFKSAEELEDAEPVRATIEQVSPFTRDERALPSNPVADTSAEPPMREPGEDD